MKPILTCTIRYFPSPHLTQIYDGFEKLRRSGIIDLKMERHSGSSDTPLLTVIVNDRYTVIYDTLDGLNWINGTIEENLAYVSKNIQADFYFKRSFNKQFLEHVPDGCLAYPLGLNYSFTPEGRYPRTLKERGEEHLKQSAIVEKVFRRFHFPGEAFEYYPLPTDTTKILFLARLWDPDEVALDQLKQEREAINEKRIRAINACRKEFGSRFTGGLQRDAYATRRANVLTIPATLTQREHFLSRVKEHDICVATTGLHHSIGWKFGEYVAASRAIITEPLYYDLPGQFRERENYLSYENEEEMVQRIGELLSDKNMLRDMMVNNYHYYSHFVRSDALVLNTLLTIVRHIS